MDRRVLAVVLAAVAVAVSVTTPVATAGASPSPPGPPVVSSTNGEGLACDPDGTLPDPEGDVLGWEDGCWYNETLPVDQADGLSEDERAAVVGRSMARVERVRELEFDRGVPVSVIGRDTYRERYGNGSNRSVSEALWLFDNAKFEAMFLVDEPTDSIEVQRRNRGTTIGGFYSPADERIVVVSENTTSPRISEVTLAQELFHALQDQHFNLSRYDQSTRERHNAVDGLVEGDGNLVDYLYERRCEAEWDCLRDTANASGGELANIGPYLLKFQPYSDGPSFVRRIRNRGGWEAVNALYENPPASTEQVIHPEKYPDDVPANVTVVDRTSGSWERVRPPGRPDHAEVGEAGLATMLVYPLYASDGRTQIIPASQWLNRTEDGDLSDIDPLNYGNRYAAGWDGDSLAVYRNGANETGYVWRLAWDSPAEAEEFVEGYRQVLDFRDAELVDPGIYVIRDGGFADAFSVEVSGATVTIVNAPTVEELSSVRRGTGDGADTPTPTEPPATPGTPETSGVPETHGTPGTSETPPTRTSGDPVATAPSPSQTAPSTATPGQPGFGIVAALLALALGTRLRRR